MRLVTAASTLLGVLLLSGCGLLPTTELSVPVDETPSGSPAPEVQPDATDSADEAPQGLKAEIIALGWECDDVSFNDSVLDEAFNCFINDEYIGLSHFLDPAQVTDYAINVSADGHCKVVSSATEAFWATHDKWLLELEMPTDTVEPLLSQLEFELERIDC